MSTIEAWKKKYLALAAENDRLRVRIDELRKKILLPYLEQKQEQYYPGIQYQRLFNAISETKAIALQDEMDEIIRIVHEDFPKQIKQTVI